MARIRIEDGETVTTETIVGLGDVLSIGTGGAIVRTGAVPAVRLTGNDAFVRNNGTIAVEGANGAALTGAFTGVLDLDIRNGVTGTIQGDSVAVLLSSANGTTGTVRFSNFGLIDGGLGNAVNMRDLRADSILVVNAAGATITNAGTSDVLRPGHDLNTEIRVVNSGTIQAGTVVGASSSGDGIDLQPQDGGVAATILNRTGGLVEGGKHAVTGANAALIVNEVDASLIGRNGSGINFDTELADGDAAVTVINHGLISGRYDGFGDGDGDGVDVDYLVNVRNFGTIEGVGADNIDDFADGIAAGGGRIVNMEGATIFGETNGILIDDGDRNGAYAETTLLNDGNILAELGVGVRLIGDFADTIINRGTIETDATVALDTGGGDDVVRNLGGIVGDVDLGIGADDYRGNGTVSGRILGGAGDDSIVTGGGNDTIVGGLGIDTMAGGTGTDVFVFAAGDTGADAATADTILDAGAGDTLDLSAIDADIATEGDEAFTFIDGAAFSGVAGELRIETIGRDTFVTADTDGDQIADLTIVLAFGSAPADIAFML